MSNEAVNKIHWQKFEESIKEQVGSSLISDIFKIVSKQVKKEVVEKSPFQEYEDDLNEDITPHVSLSEELMEDISTAGKYECWIGHSNFSITPSLANKIAKVDGVEALKVVTRYRFLVGIGKMFKFSDVCQGILKVANVQGNGQNEHRPENSEDLQE